MNFDRVIEEIIRKAQEEGKFDNLPGKGRPLTWDENPFEDPAWQMANKILRDGGFRPGWLEDEVELREKVARARTALVRTRDWRASELAALGTREDPEARHKRALIADEWSRALDRFRESLERINAAIAALNLKVPHVRFQRAKLGMEEELQKLL